MTTSEQQSCTGTIAEDSKSEVMNYRTILRLVTQAITAASILWVAGTTIGLSEIEATALPAAMFLLILVYFAGERRGAQEMAEALDWRDRLEVESDE